MLARDPLTSAEHLPMRERNHDFLSVLAAGPPGSSPSYSGRGPGNSPDTAAAAAAHWDGTLDALDGKDDHDEALHAADGLEEFEADGGEVEGKVGGSRTGAPFDSRRRPAEQPPAAPYSSYALSGTPALGQFGTPQLNEIGRDPPRAVVRVERDWVAGDVAQFHTSFPLELEGRISATQFQDLINDVNTVLLGANSYRHAVVDNVLMVATLHLSLLFGPSHFQKELAKLDRLIDHKNAEVWHPAGLAVRSPRAVAFQFLEIEYY